MNNVRKIDNFRGQYFFLSNFYPASVTYLGYTFKNNEAAFQGAKNLDDMPNFVDLDPSTAKKRGRHVKLRKDWEDVKTDIMYEICKAKFTQNYILGKKLVETGNSELIEGNTWGDRVWGVCDGRGENRLGKILMKIREEIKEYYEIKK